MFVMVPPTDCIFQSRPHIVTYRLKVCTLQSGEPETMVDTVPAGSVAATQFGFNTGFGGGGAFGGGGFNVQPHGEWNLL